jgi:hypothetical protein
MNIVQVTDFEGKTACKSRLQVINSGHAREGELLSSRDASRHAAGCAGLCLGKCL